MDNVVFANPQLVHGVWPALALVAVLAFLEFRHRDLLGRFVSPAMQARLASSASVTRRAVKLALVLLTLLCGVVGLMRPQTPGGTEAIAARKVSADIMVVLDVSKSMLAEDAAPNRLARAKADIAEFVDRVTGHRVGLVAFAGRAVVMSPLTTDYGYFHLVLRNVDTSVVSRGGTRIGDAMRKAVAAFGPNRGVSRVMLLITDGEDHDMPWTRRSTPASASSPSALAARRAARSRSPTRIPGREASWSTPTGSWCVPVSTASCCASWRSVPKASTSPPAPRRWTSTPSSRRTSNPW
ncbi:MAG: VWA domain-containing protein [Pseudomonadales bacterium]|nr:VWA domain-containing protein [Pseudomonadales bacterium]